MHSTPWGRVGVLLVAGTVTLLGSGPAQAHSSIIGSNPKDGSVVRAMPRTIELTYNEDLDTFGSGLAMRRGDDAPVRLRADIDGRTVTAAAPAGAPDGTYTVAWRVVSADGHPINGLLRFRVGPGDDEPVAGARGPEEVQGENVALILAVAAPLLLLVAGGSWLLRRRSQNRGHTS